MTFDEVLRPLTKSQFIADYLGERWLRLEGQEGRFAHLAPWSELNAILSRDRFTGERVRLVKNGRAIPREAYLRRPDDENGSQIDTTGLLQHLRGGATLLLSAVDELFPAVRGLCEELEELFRIAITVNLYAGWKTDNAFDLHFDPHDTLILQLAGRKHWRVYNPTRVHPLARDIGKIQKPTDDPVWDGELRDGDVLYMPRGWWHVAFPMDQPSLHLTFGIEHCTGANLASWIAKELEAESLVRADLPHLASESAQEAYAAEFANLVRQRLTPDLVANFMRWQERRLRPRPHISLPDDVTAETTRLDEQSVLRLAADRRLHLQAEAGNGHVSFKASGEAWSCEASLVPALTLLRGSRGTPMRTLIDAVPTSARGALRLTLTVMVTGGAILVSRS